jgi:hypothetical protein
LKSHNRAARTKGQNLYKQNKYQKQYKICKIQSTKGDFVILLDMFVYVLKLPYRFLMYVLSGLYGYKNKK